MASGLIDAPADILVINVSRIGDTLLSTPALRAIAARYPEARITFLGHPKRVEVMRHLPYLHRAGAITKERALLKGRLTGTRYDLAFVYGSDAALFEYAFRVARRVVGFRQPEPRINGRLFRAVVHPAPQTTHAVMIQLMLPQAVGIAPTGLALDYRVSPREAAWAAGRLAALSTRASPRDAFPLIGLQVASFPTKAYRDWPLSHFIELCRLILARHPAAHFLIFGGREEQTRTSALKQALGAAATLYAGRLTLRQTAALMNRVDLYIGVDTGPTHIMGALHRPLVALYHGYSPSRVLAPLDHPCAYVVDHPRADRCTPEASMGEISVSAVWASVERALAQIGQPA